MTAAQTTDRGADNRPWRRQPTAAQTTDRGAKQARVNLGGNGIVCFLFSGTHFCTNPARCKPQAFCVSCTLLEDCATPRAIHNAPVTSN